MPHQNRNIERLQEYRRVTEVKTCLAKNTLLRHMLLYVNQSLPYPLHQLTKKQQLNHINTLTRMLANIRKPYLNVDSRNPPLSRQGSRNIDLGGSEQNLSGIRHLTNEERDQIDLQARVILTRCADRVKEMEALEKRTVYFPALF